MSEFEFEDKYPAFSKSDKALLKNQDLEHSSQVIKWFYKLRVVKNIKQALILIGVFSLLCLIVCIILIYQNTVGTNDKYDASKKNFDQPKVRAPRN